MSAPVATALVHDDDEIQNVIERYADKLKAGFNGIFFVMSKETHQAFGLTVLAMFIDMGQLTSFALPDPSFFDMAFTPNLRAFAAITKLFQFEKLLFSSSGQQDIQIGFVLVVVCSLLLNVAYVGYSWVHQNFQYIWTVRLLRKTAAFLVGIGYIPIVSVLASAFQCSSGGVYCTILQIVVSIVGLMFIPFSLATTSTVRDV